MSLQDSMAARQRFYEILGSAGVGELDTVRVHVGLAALLGASYRFDLKHHCTQEMAAGHGARPGGSSRMVAGRLSVREEPRPDWLPDHLHYNHLLQHAPADLALQLDLASATVKAEAPVPHLFFGYANLGMGRAQLLELMELMARMYPKMKAGLRTFLPAEAAELELAASALAS